MTLCVLGYKKANTVAPAAVTRAHNNSNAEKVQWSYYIAIE